MQIVKDIITFLYFLCLAPLIFGELSYLVMPKRIFAKNQQRKELSDKASKNGLESLTDSELKRHKRYFLYAILLLATLFFGLFTDQWLLFITLVVFSSISSWITNRVVKQDSVKIVVSYVDAVLTFSVLLFIIVNQYHLHIDILGAIKSCF